MVQFLSFLHFQNPHHTHFSEQELCIFMTSFSREIVTKSKNQNDRTMQNSNNYLCARFDIRGVNMEKLF